MFRLFSFWTWGNYVALGPPTGLGVGMMMSHTNYMLKKQQRRR